MADRRFQGEAEAHARRASICSVMDEPEWQSGKKLRRPSNCYHIHFDQHSRPCELIDIQEGVYRLRSPAECFRAALSRLDQISNVSDVGDNLNHVVHRSAVGRQQPLDLVIGVAALASEVAEM